MVIGKQQRLQKETPGNLGHFHFGKPVCMTAAQRFELQELLLLAKNKTKQNKSNQNISLTDIIIQVYSLHLCKSKLEWNIHYKTIKQH